MRYHELFERGRTSSISSKEDEKILDKLKQECPIAWNYYEKREKPPFYRGLSGNRASVLYGDSSKGRLRKSANTTNYYTMLFDHILPSWKDYPDRSRSWICTSSHYYASGYGSTYYVFPIGNPNLGVCPRRDIWGSFTPRFGSLPGFNVMLVKISKILKVPRGATVERINNLFDKINELSDEYIDDVLCKKFNDSNYGNIGNSSRFMKGFIEYRKRGGSFIDYVDKEMSPSENNFHLISLDEYASNYGLDDNEIWFSGPSYFVLNYVLNYELEKLVGNKS